MQKVVKVIGNVSVYAQVKGVLLDSVDEKASHSLFVAVAAGDDKAGTSCKLVLLSSPFPWPRAPSKRRLFLYPDELGAAGDGGCGCLVQN